MTGTVHPFFFATSFFAFSNVMLNSLTWLTFSFNCLLIFSIHGMFGVLSFSFPSTSPKLDKLFHFCHLSFMCFLSFQRSEESLLVSLKHDIALLPFLFFLHILPTLSFSNSACPAFAPLHFSLVVFFSIKTLNSLMISFSLLVAFIRCFLLYSSFLVFAMI